MAPDGHLNMFLRIWMFAIHTQKHLTQGQTHSVKSWGMGANRTTIFVKKPGPLPLVLAQPHLQHPRPRAPPHKVPREMLQGCNGKQSKTFLATAALVPSVGLRPAGLTVQTVLSSPRPLKPVSQTLPYGRMQSPAASVSGKESWGSS